MDMGEFSSVTAPNAELFRAVHETRFVRNFLAPDDEGLHPLFIPLHYALPEDPDEAVHLFIERIDALDESDYGDFMREVNLYILDLEDSLLPSPEPLRAKLQEMQAYTQFQPNWDVDSTKKRLLSDARMLAEMLTEVSRGL